MFRGNGYCIIIYTTYHHPLHCEGWWLVSQSQTLCVRVCSRRLTGGCPAGYILVSAPPSKCDSWQMFFLTFPSFSHHLVLLAILLTVLPFQSTKDVQDCAPNLWTVHPTTAPSTPHVKYQTPLPPHTVTKHDSNTAKWMQEDTFTPIPHHYDSLSWYFEKGKFPRAFFR